MQISVRVKAGSKKEVVEALPNNRFKVSVKPKAQGGRANERTLELIAAHFKVSLKKVHLVRGRKTPSKIFAIDTPIKK